MCETEHVCEWEYIKSTSSTPLGEVTEHYFKCAIPTCRKIMWPHVAVDMLNEYETLKKATDALGAKFATQEADDMQGRLDSMMIAVDNHVLYHPYRDEQLAKIKVLRAYANILEKK